MSVLNGATSLSLAGSGTLTEKVTKPERKRARRSGTMMKKSSEKIVVIVFLLSQCAGEAINYFLLFKRKNS